MGLFTVYGARVRIFAYQVNECDSKRINISLGKQLKANFNILHDYLTVLVLFKTWNHFQNQYIRKIEKEGKSSDSENLTFQAVSKQIQNNYGDNNISASENITVQQQQSQQLSQSTSSFNQNKMMKNNNSKPNSSNQALRTLKIQIQENVMSLEQQKD